MSGSKHTQGEWELELLESGAFAIFTPPQFDMGWFTTIASRGQWAHNAAESHANARLLWAAPDLLAALKLAIAELDGGPETYAALDAAHAAIAKAEGTEP